MGNVITCFLHALDTVLWLFWCIVQRLLKGDRTREQGDVVDSGLKRICGYQAVERSRMPYFFYLTE